MKKVTFLGLGAMGSRMALNLINAGYDVCVWNRSFEHTSPLVKKGARTASSPRTASNDADLVISMVRDDEASKEIWLNQDTGALAGMKTGAIAVECSTLSLGWIKELHKHTHDKGIALLDAPVAGSRPQAESAQLIFLVGGDQPIFDQAKPILAAMGSVIHYTGTSSSGTTIKLAVNTLFGIQLSALAELIGFFNASGIDVNKALNILTSTPVCSPAAKLAVEAMLTKNFAPMFPIHLVEKDFVYTVKSAQEYNQPTPLAEATMLVFRQAIEKGFSKDNITGVAQLYI